MTPIRSYIIRTQQFGISTERQREMEAFCAQYEEKKQKLNSYYLSTSTDPEAQLLRRDVNLIDECLKTVSEEVDDKSGEIVAGLRKNVLYRQGFDSLGLLPCGKNQFYKIRRTFFRLLDRRLKERRL